ncbi:hypothetical protein AV654_19715 [Paenibacillus elgii]|uniref:Uncharacterized protein n=1 Tax=Paenibacillus elgii TaxID=189691 RepID=A0A161SCN8_9BACL|nr:hypothetical protein [Paenibacillus elgii]KZE78205.1 hypothetical protein AV654_19715 [Paenibacillus elgii]
MEATMRFFLSTLQSFGKMNEPQLKDVVLRSCKSIRKAKSKDEVISQGANIYRNRPVLVESLLEEAFQQNYIAVSEMTEHGRQLELTNEGLLALTIFWTDSFSDAFKNYEAELTRRLHDCGQIALPRIDIMKMYKSNSIEEVIERYTRPMSTHRLSKGYHEHVMREYGGITDIPEDDFVFHLFPKLFVPPDLIGKKVTLKVEGLPVPALSISIPYPNRRYYVAGMKKERSRSAYGCYPIIGPKEHFPSKAKVSLYWIIDDCIRIDHHLEIDFQFASSAGQFFSTEQYFSRPLPYKTFSLITTIDRLQLGRERHADIIVRDIYNHFEISESATLSNFPMELHRGQSGAHYSKWYDEQVKKGGGR